MEGGEAGLCDWLPPPSPDRSNKEAPHRCEAFVSDRDAGCGHRFVRLTANHCTSRRNLFQPLFADRAPLQYEIAV